MTNVSDLDLRPIKGPGTCTLAERGKMMPTEVFDVDIWEAFVTCRSGVVYCVESVGADGFDSAKNFNTMLAMGALEFGWEPVLVRVDDSMWIIDPEWEGLSGPIAVRKTPAGLKRLDWSNKQKEFI